MYLFSKDFLNDLAARITGPMSFRFIFQPAMAIILGIRDGLKDAKLGNPPIFIELILNRQDRAKNFKSVMKSLLVPIIIGTVLDGIAQYLMFRNIRPLPALLVGAFIMAIPYLFARGLTNRIVSLKKK